ncbi:hypothetical protein ANCDUO_23994 [Ancylostoma duodenale]|uniref:Uncharacterized protein n=1 Tax=Ancylostoma duodenale TaxID=51022 RepID=A0A0C2FM79_9BILA|nr:hypothetical protein ANCDUO_23994 [Ancylostoma duodenale]
MGIIGIGMKTISPPSKPPPPKPPKKNTRQPLMHLDNSTCLSLRILTKGQIFLVLREETTIQDSGNSVRNLMGGGASENAWSTIMLFMDIGGPGMATAFLKTTCPSPKPPPPKPPKKKTRQPPI